VFLAIVLNLLVHLFDQLAVALHWELLESLRELLVLVFGHFNELVIDLVAQVGLDLKAVAKFGAYWVELLKIN
jgi:hypothetical protein